LQVPSLLHEGAGQAPQSAVQLSQVSSALQVPSPQTLGAAQSAGQVRYVSSPVHWPSPQRLGAAQSAGQLALVSPPVHFPSPHVGLAACAPTGGKSSTLISAMRSSRPYGNVGALIPNDAR